MFEIHHYASFIAAIVAFQMVPGAGTVAILSATARGGKRAGMAAVAGTLTGDFLFMAAAVAGLAAAMRSHPALFEALRWIGAGYLCWIGARHLIARARPAAVAAAPRGRRRAAFRRGLAVSLTNPKVILFFVSFFPLFIERGAGVATLAVMMLHVTAVSLAYQTVLVLLGDSVATRLRTDAIGRRLAGRVAGAALLGCGIRLALDDR